MYHYTADDFDIIGSHMSLREAYKIWIDETFPKIPQRYKKKLESEFKVKALKRGWSSEYKEEKYNKFLEDFKLIKFKKPSLRGFAQLLKRNNINYKQKEH